MVKMRLYILGGLFLLCFLQGCSAPRFPVDKDLNKAIQLDLKGRNCFQDPTSMQDSLIFIGIVFNNNGNKESLKIFHQTAPPFYISPEASNCYIGTWKGKGYYITVINDLPQETSFKDHLNLQDFDTSFDNYLKLCAHFIELFDVSYDGKYYRTIGEYENGRLIISKSGWFYDP